MKLLFNILLILNLFNASSAHSQNHIPFRNCLNEAGYWFYDQQYDSAHYYFTLATKYKYKFYPIDSHLYSRTLWELGEQKKAIQILIKGGIAEFFETDTSFYLGMTQSKRKKNLKRMPTVESAMTPKNHLFFDTLMMNDTKYRRQLEEIKYNTEHFMYLGLINKLRQQDSLNQIALLNYIKLYGYPGGYLHADPSVSRVLIHSNSNWIFKNYDLFIKEIKEGRMDSWALSRAVDRYFHNETCPNSQIYNSYFGKDQFESIKPESVFINSCQIGLDPYFDNMNFRIYPRGKKPDKTALYEYYKKNKSSFNCVRFN